MRYLAGGLEVGARVQAELGINSEGTRTKGPSLKSKRTKRTKAKQAKRLNQKEVVSWETLDEAEPVDLDWGVPFEWGSDHSWRGTPLINRKG